MWQSCSGSGRGGRRGNYVAVVGGVVGVAIISGSGRGGRCGNHVAVVGGVVGVAIMWREWEGL